MDPLRFTLFGSPYGIPRIDLGTTWNFLGYGYDANTNWIANPGRFYSGSILFVVYSIMIKILLISLISLYMVRDAFDDGSNGGS